MRSPIFGDVKKILVFSLLLLSLSCFAPERNCEAYRTGTFTFTAEVDGEEHTTLFTRTETLELSEYQGKTDSASVRWINDCEYILTDLSSEAPKPIHMKILSTTENSYTFEYKLVGSTQTSRGTAFKTE